MNWPAPMRLCDMPQHLMEPVLVNAAVSRGTALRFHTEYLSHEQSDDCVTALVEDRLRGDTYRVRARCLVGADGGRSRVVENAGLPTVGRMGVAGSLNIVFEADLTHLTAHRPSTLYWVLAPGATVGGIGAGLVRCVRPWTEWMVVWGYDLEAGPPDLTEEFARSVVHRLLGDDTIPVRITSTSAWTVNHLYAESYADRRVLCAGRRRPPPPAVQRAGLQHLHPGRVQPRLEAQAGPRRHRCPRPSGHLLRRTGSGGTADRRAGQSEHR